MTTSIAVVPPPLQQQPPHGVAIPLPHHMPLLRQAPAHCRVHRQPLLQFRRQAPQAIIAPSSGQSALLVIVAINLTFLLHYSLLFLLC